MAAIEFNHKNLVLILAVGTYGSSNIIIRTPKEYKHLAKGECREDCWAEVLLGGGKLEFIDNLSEEPVDDWEAEGNPELAVRCEPFEDRGHGEDQWGCVVYQIGLEDFKKPQESDRGKELLDIMINGDGGDYYDGWNYLQLVMFGEEIYG